MGTTRRFPTAKHLKLLVPTLILSSLLALEVVPLAGATAAAPSGTAAVPVPVPAPPGTAAVPVPAAAAAAAAVPVPEAAAAGVPAPAAAAAPGLEVKLIFPGLDQGIFDRKYGSSTLSALAVSAEVPESYITWVTRPQTTAAAAAAKPAALPTAAAAGSTPAASSSNRTASTNTTTAAAPAAAAAGAAVATIAEPAAAKAANASSTAAASQKGVSAVAAAAQTQAAEAPPAAVTADSAAPPEADTKVKEANNAATPKELAAPAAGKPPAAAAAAGNSSSSTKSSTSQGARRLLASIAAAGAAGTPTPGLIQTNAVAIYRITAASWANAKSVASTLQMSAAPPGYAFLQNLKRRGVPYDPTTYVDGAMILEGRPAFSGSQREAPDVITTASNVHMRAPVDDRSSDAMYGPLPLWAFIAIVILGSLLALLLIVGTCVLAWIGLRACQEHRAERERDQFIKSGEGSESGSEGLTKAPGGGYAPTKGALQQLNASFPTPAPVTKPPGSVITAYTTATTVRSTAGLLDAQDGKKMSFKTGSSAPVDQDRLHKEGKPVPVLPHSRLIKPGASSIKVPRAIKTVAV